MTTHGETPAPPPSAPLAEGRFAPLATTYLNTASTGVLPLAAAEALAETARDAARGRAAPEHGLAAVAEVREAFARLVGVPAERVAVGNGVAVYAGLLAGSLPDGAEVLVAEGDFSALITPFAVRPGLKLRSAPLERLAGQVGPQTAVVAVSAAQSADGRVADLAALRAAVDAQAEGGRRPARIVVDGTQALGWLTVDPAHYDFLLCSAYKWLLCPHGVSLMVVSGDAGSGVVPRNASWVAGEEPWNSTYGPVEQFARSARRFDERPAFLAHLAARHSLALLEEIGTERVAAHDLALAAAFRRGAEELGLRPVPARAPIVSVPGLAEAADALREAGIDAAVRAGSLRASFHLYNTAADVDRVLEVLAELTARGGGRPLTDPAG
ncbi:aminotransferase class V-fold PLP-dependent enzyme [Streptomyces sp. JJ36]|uniref:aminotransferase class V-fold PLP-dependent enzyme n=1 Tax=Streptomyces sp. JJ36 TaxID=2736645 RepID=UPI001F353667|nr:aminotransferase class V-fold PLP-dependent enzyme [Streptomyces sp. JJ36]MCF6523345.1 aminotransferase class V-fold PLP-dependent enzyme [Streptomyces sp. JJ36]